MTIAILSTKYQLVVPKDIRRSLKLAPGQRLEFTEKDGHIEIRPILTPDQLIGFLKAEKPLQFQREPDREF